MRNRRLILILLAVAAGVAGGYLYRRWQAPTLEERADDAAKDLRRGFEKLVK
jgi:Flp pilus assembly protein CpaB